MKILKIEIFGLPLYKNKFEVSFLATQRVQDNHLDSLYNLIGNIYKNNVESFIGINASGKTVALRVISFVNMLIGATPLNAPYVPKILRDDIETIFEIDFFINNKIFHLSSHIIKNKTNDGINSIRILKEKLYEKSINSKVNKTNLFNFDNIKPIRIRNDNDEYLSSDVSIMIAVNKQLNNKLSFIDLAQFTNFNFFKIDSDIIPEEVIILLDPTVEYIKTKFVNDKFSAKLKFYNQKEILIYNPVDFELYLSSGTIKGIRVFIDAIKTLKIGGYLIIDEIENHFNKELVLTLMRLFLSKKTNPNGATLIFSTHYSELLDEIDRNDAIFITKNNNGLTIENLNNLLTRNDLKKSEVYQSNYLKGTAPKYDSINSLNKKIISMLEDKNEN